MNDMSCSSILENRGPGGTAHILTTLPPPPAKSHRTVIAGFKQSSLVGENDVSPSHQTQSQPSSLVLGSSVNNPESPSSSPVDISLSPKHSQSFSGDKGWPFFPKEDGSSKWTNFEEHHHLLGNEDDSERHSSDDDCDIWSITDEQRDYYVAQFKLMQPDLKKKITGAVAKEFFEKSKLPVTELSKIWQLSDVDKDGALSIEEFCTAMHLVVLRRNSIELPDLLPATLIPKIAKNEAEAPQVPNATQPHAAGSPKQTSPSDLVSPQSKEWTKFNDSPTSSLSSPGMKPVNFDFSAASVEQDPKILHPVALRLSPERQSAAYSSSEKEQSVDEVLRCNQAQQATVIQRPIPRKPLGASLSNALTTQTSDSSEMISASIHSSSFSGSSDASKASNLTSSASQVAVGLPQGPKKEPPPPPPPRPKHNHIRSSSLDLNRLGAPPAVPPRISPNSATPHRGNFHLDDHHMSGEFGFADFAKFDEPDTHLQLKSGAFEVYKKPSSQEGTQLSTSAGSGSFLLEQMSTPSAVTDDSTALLVDVSHADESCDRKRHPAAQPLAMAAASIKSVPRDKRELQAAIRAHRERNMMLSLLNNELNQELSEVMEERIALEIQLEHLRPFT